MDLCFLSAEATRDSDNRRHIARRPANTDEVAGRAFADTDFVREQSMDIGRHVAANPAINAIVEELDRAQTRRSRVVRILAPEGGGKTRLLEDAMSALAGRAIYAVRALSWETESPGWVAQRLIERLPAPGRHSGKNARVSGFEAQNLIAGAIGASEPGTLIVIDDAHFADPFSLKTLGTALQLSPRSNVLVILLVDESVASPSATLTRELADTDIVVPYFRLVQVRSLLGQHTGIDAPQELARSIFALTAGEPSTTIAMIEHLAATGWTSLDQIPVPPHIAAPTKATLDGLEDESRALAEHVAVLGTATSWDELAAFAGIDDAESLAARLDPLCEANLLTVHADPGATWVRFSAPLDRNIVLSSLPPTRIRALHLRAAELFADLDIDASLAHRAALSTGQDQELADRHASRAAELADNGDWYSAARTLLTAARLDPTPESATRRRRQGVDGLIEAGHIDEATYMSTAMQSAAPSPERDAVFGYLAVMRGKKSEATMLLERARASLGDRGHAGVTSLASKSVMHALASWNPADMLHWSDIAALDSAVDIPSTQAARAIGGLATLISASDDPTSADEDSNGFAVHSGYVQRFELAAGWGAFAADEPARARRHFESALAISPEKSSERITIQAQAWLAYTHFLLGTWDEAIRIIETAARRVSDLGLELLAPLVHGTGAMIRSMRDDPVGASRHIVHLNPPVDSYPLQTIPSAMAAIQVAASRGDYAEVRRAGAPLAALGHNVDFDQPGYWPWFELYAHALVLGGRIREAETLIDPIWRRAEPVGHATTLASIESVRARISGIRGEHEEMQALLDSSIERVSPLGIPYRLARLHFAAGQTLRRAGRRKEADHSLGMARDLYEQFGATVYVRRCDRERKAGGVNVERGPRQDLTPQEKAVASLVAAGHSNAEVADELYLSIKTIQYHLTRIYAKLGIRGRSELAAMYAAEISE